MSRRCIRAAVAAATFVAMAWLAPQPVGPGAAGQFLTVVEAAGAGGGGGQEADLPRTADGHPDMQGYWEGGPGNASHSIEDGCCDPIHARMQSRGRTGSGCPSS